MRLQAPNALANLKAKLKGIFKKKSATPTEQASDAAPTTAAEPSTAAPVTAAATTETPAIASAASPTGKKTVKALSCCG